MLVRRLLTAAAVVPALLLPANAHAPDTRDPLRQQPDHPPGCSATYTRGDFHRAARHSFRAAPYTSHERRTLRRVVRCLGSARSRANVRQHLRRYKRAYRVRAQWAYFAAHPMPDCTWVGESGGNYRARNPSSTAGGKYQIIDSTWYANGGGRYRDSHPAAVAPPLEQERVARRVRASQGLAAWVNC